MVLFVEDSAPNLGRNPKVLTDKFTAGDLGGRKLAVLDFSDTADLFGLEEF